MVRQHAIRTRRVHRRFHGRARLLLSAELWAVVLAVALLPAWAAQQFRADQAPWPLGMIAATMHLPDALASERDAAGTLEVSDSWLETDDVWKAGDRYARVTATGPSGLRVRSGPAATYPAIYILREAATVRIVTSFLDDHHRRWVEVAGPEDSDVSGWSSAEFLTPLPPGTVPTEAELGQALLGRIIPVKVTAYTYQVPGNGAHGWITKSGDLAAWGIVAVDPRIIPLGSQLAIDGYNDLFLASDTGFGVMGRHVDIFFAEHHRAVEFGVQQRDVIVYEQESPV